MRLAPLVLLALAPLAAATAATDFAWDGTISTGVAACAPAIGCRSAQLPQDQIRSVGLLAGSADLRATLSWESATPLGEELRLGVSFDTPSGREHAFVEGPSPLTLQRTVVAQGEVLVWANFPQTLPPAPVWASHEQAFRVEGSLTLR